ncbi:hypothetical protein WH47_02480 [Habropoda laboriosa]|uniref:Uncharacterized protein n=1 Tax=Habropoda laboriosa TaxID=597456 RepID=A0A0L7QYD8_9HYME|nr:hypothetical protein WH47_02480 [Habropoda laboriosa]
MGELEERKKRQNNLIIFNIAEADSLPITANTSNGHSDSTTAISILNEIRPNDYSNVLTMKIDRNINNKSRPIVITLPTTISPIDILKYKRNYKGPARIAQDLTEQQRTHLKKLRDQLRSQPKEPDSEQQRQAVHPVEIDQGERKLTTPAVNQSSRYSSRSITQQTSTSSSSLSTPDTREHLTPGTATPYRQRLRAEGRQGRRPYLSSSYKYLKGALTRLKNFFVLSANTVTAASLQKRLDLNADLYEKFNSIQC